MFPTNIHLYFIFITIFSIFTANFCDNVNKIKKNIAKEKLKQPKKEPIKLTKEKKIEPKKKVENKESTRELIDDLYKHVKHQISDEERSMVSRTGGSPVYGEILFDSLKTILDEQNITKDDVLYDLGSGIGKVVIQSYLDYPFKKVVGIELSPTRFCHSEAIKKKLEKKGKIDKNRKFELIKEDIAKSNLNDATIIYMCSTCYPDELMETLTKNFSKLKNGLRIITLKRLPDYEKYGISFVKEYKLPMTWKDASPVYLYELKKAIKSEEKRSKK